MPARSAADEAAHLLDAAVAARVFPAAVAEVGHAGGVLWRHISGTHSFDSAVPTHEHTIFDLASLTKPLATTSLILERCAQNRLALDQPVAQHFPEWRGTDREAVTIQDLLEHSSGLPARLFERAPESRREFEHEICDIPLEYGPRTRALYSDLDFILLGFLAHDADARFETLLRAVEFPESANGAYLGYGVASRDHLRCAPTEPMAEDRRRRRLVGEVHDNYAAALGGLAGHAGLFGTAGAVGWFARLVLTAALGQSKAAAPFSQEWIARARRKSTVPRSSRALGWDTMLPTSSCGTRMSTDAFGHVGFTGTSLWIDPARDRYFVLLTNRVCGGGTSEEMQVVRRAFHDTLADL